MAGELQVSVKKKGVKNEKSKFELSVAIGSLKKVEPVSPECSVSPDALAAILHRIFRDDPKGYKNIVKAVCIYGEIPVEQLIKMSKEIAQ